MNSSLGTVNWGRISVLLAVPQILLPILRPQPIQSTPASPPKYMHSLAKTPSLPVCFEHVLSDLIKTEFVTDLGLRPMYFWFFHTSILNFKSQYSLYFQQGFLLVVKD